MLRSFNWVWPQHSLNIVSTFFQPMLKQCCDRLTWYDFKIVSTFSQQTLQKSCNSLTWHSVNIINKWCEQRCVCLFPQGLLSFTRRTDNGVLYGGSTFWACGRNAMVLPFKRNLFGSTFTWYYFFPSRAIFVWPRNENAWTKQKQQTNGKRAIWLVYRTDTNARGFWLFKRTLGWKNFMPESFLEINGCFALTSYCNMIGQSNNAFSILGFSLGRKRRGRVLIFSPIG